MSASKIGCLATCDSFRILDFGEVIIYIQYPAQLATGAKNGIMGQFFQFHGLPGQFPTMSNCIVCITSRLLFPSHKKYNKEARWLYAELKSHISFLAKSHENSLMRLYKKAHLAVAA